MAKQLNWQELTAGLPEIRKSPKNPGVLKAIVIRPATELRVSIERCEISAELGVHGDNWAKGCWLSLDDGTPHPDVQIAMTNSRLMALVAQQEDRWSLAGDNFYVDLDLTAENLPPGQRLAIGTAIIEITAEAHNGCQKYAQRFGTDAVKFVNSDVGKQLHLRGIYAKVVQSGVVNVGDKIRKV